MYFDTKYYVKCKFASKYIQQENCYMLSEMNECKGMIFQSENNKW